MKTKYQMLKQALSGGLTKERIRNKDFSHFNFSGWDFSDLDFRSADFGSADFGFANFSSADFRSADFSSADFGYADFRSANLSVEINECTTGLLSICPDGEFIAWKKASEKIVKLLIPTDAKRSNATTAKCRCNKAMVLDIQNLDGSKSNLSEIASSRNANFVYKIGEMVEVYDFDENRWNECSTGIHFFINRELAKQY